MLRSFCVKTNNNQMLDFMKYEFENSNVDEMYISMRKFKNYQNIILHYKGEDIDNFHALIAGVLTNTIFTFYEEFIIKNILLSNYFYFSELDRKQILEYCMEMLGSSEKEKLYRRNIVFSACFDYIEKNKYMVLDGFVNFRLKKFSSSLDEIADMAVDKFVLEREFNEFISLLKLYVNSKEAELDSVHLIYHDEESILLDSHKNIVNTSSDIFNAKYLSDISFSSNDYALNALLNLLPERLYIHLIDGLEDEFINTLKLIFENRVNICTDCAICNLYKLPSKNKSIHN